MPEKLGGCMKWKKSRTDYVAAFGREIANMRRNLIDHGIIDPCYQIREFSNGELAIESEYDIIHLPRGWVQV